MKSYSIQRGVRGVIKEMEHDLSIRTQETAEGFTIAKMRDDAGRNGIKMWVGKSRYYGDADPNLVVLAAMTEHDLRQLIKDFEQYRLINLISLKRKARLPASKNERRIRAYVKMAFQEAGVKHPKFLVAEMTRDIINKSLDDKTADALDTQAFITAAQQVQGIIVRWS